MYKRDYENGSPHGKGAKYGMNAAVWVGLPHKRVSVTKGGVCVGGDPVYPISAQHPLH